MLKYTTSPTPNCRYQNNVASEILDNKYERVGSGNSARSGAARTRLKLKMANRKTETWGKGGKGGKGGADRNGSNRAATATAPATATATPGVQPGAAGTAIAGKKKKKKKKGNTHSLPANVLSSLSMRTKAAAAAAATAAGLEGGTSSTADGAASTRRATAGITSQQYAEQLRNNAERAEMMRFGKIEAAAASTDKETTSDAAPMHPKLKKLMELKNPTPAQAKLRDAIQKTLAL